MVACLMNRTWNLQKWAALLLGGDMGVLMKPDCPSIAFAAKTNLMLDRHFPTVFEVSLMEHISRVCSKVHTLVQFGAS